MSETINDQSLYFLEVLAQTESGSSFLFAQLNPALCPQIKILLDKEFVTYQIEKGITVLKITEKGRSEVFIKQL